MDRSAELIALAATCEQAVASADWDGLQRLVDALPARLRELAALGPLAEHEQAAQARLRRAWDSGAAACGRAARELGARLDDMHVNKEGRMAYALAGGADRADIGQ